jgi:iron complex outermembrane receptor protein
MKPICRLISDLGRTGVAVSLAAMCGGLASAAEQSSASALEEVIVTAERREANLQNVPIAITAVSGEALDRSAVRSTVDLQTMTPGLILTTNAVQGQPYIRGIGSDILNVGTDGSVAVHVDGVYQSRPSSAVQDFLDVQRVEVVKGPQGTLYGRNATGGAINIITNDPEHEFGGRVDLNLGNYSKYGGDAVVNVPIVDDKVALRVAVLGSSRDGFTHNLLDGSTSDGEGLWAYRAKLRFDPRSDLSIILAGDAVRENSDRNLGPKVDASLPSPAVDFFGAVIPAGPRDVRYDNPTWSRKYADAGTLKIEWNAGPVVLRSLTSLNDLEFHVNLDIDATEVPFTWDTVHEQSRVVSEELQLASRPGGKLDWMVGLYYLDEKARQTFHIYFTPFQADINYSDVRNDTKASALFGQLTYKPADRMRITAGARYSSEKRNAHFHEIVNDPFGILTGIPGGALLDLQNDSSQTWHAWTPKLGIDYAFTPDVMAYASVTRGFKSGGFNLLGSGEVFQPEFIWSYDAGFKSTFLDRRLRMNLSAFYYDYSDLQVNRFNPATGGATSTVTNAASAEIKGFEAELLAMLAPRLELDSSLALLDAKFKRFETSNPDAADPFALQQLGGNTLPRAPKVTATLGLQYTAALGGGRSLALRGEARYQGHIWFDQFNATDVDQSAFTLLNGFATLRGAEDRWHVQLYGRNLTDRLYKQSVVRATSLIGTLDFWGAPRTFGAEVGYRF